MLGVVPAREDRPTQTNPLRTPERSVPTSRQSSYRISLAETLAQRGTIFGRDASRNFRTPGVEFCTPQGTILVPLADNSGTPYQRKPIQSAAR